MQPSVKQKNFLYNFPSSQGGPILAIRQLYPPFEAICERFPFSLNLYRALRFVKMRSQFAFLYCSLLFKQIVELWQKILKKITLDLRVFYFQAINPLLNIVDRLCYRFLSNFDFQMRFDIFSMIFRWPSLVINSSALFASHPSDLISIRILPIILTVPLVALKNAFFKYPGTERFFINLS